MNRLVFSKIRGEHVLALQTTEHRPVEKLTVAQLLKKLPVSFIEVFLHYRYATGGTR
jgi:hypothetical protein